MSRAPRVKLATARPQPQIAMQETTKRPHLGPVLVFSLKRWSLWHLQRWRFKHAPLTPSNSPRSSLRALPAPLARTVRPLLPRKRLTFLLRAVLGRLPRPRVTPIVRMRRATRATFSTRVWLVIVTRSTLTCAMWANTSTQTAALSALKTKNVH